MFYNLLIGNLTIFATKGMSSSMCAICPELPSQVNNLELSERRQILNLMGNEFYLFHHLNYWS